MPIIITYDKRYIANNINIAAKTLPNLNSATFTGRVLFAIAPITICIINNATE